MSWLTGHTLLRKAKKDVLGVSVLELHVHSISGEVGEGLWDKTEGSRHGKEERKKRELRIKIR